MAGIRGGAEGPQIRINEEPGRREIQISGPSRQRTVQELRRLVKAGQLPPDQEEELIRSIEWEETTTRADFRDIGGVGGPKARKSMLKSMVTAGLLGGLTWLDMLSAVFLLRGSGRGGPCLMFRDSPVRPLGDVSLPIRRHCVHIETDMEARKVWGYAEYFGTWCAIAQLGKCYLGEPTQWTYCVDPVTGEDLTHSVEVNLDAARGLISEMCAAPARSPDILREQVADPQPLVDECCRVHGVEGRIVITESTYGEENPYGNSKIREMTWIDKP